MKWLLLSSFFLLTTPAEADTRTVGNGGSVVACGDKAELLDIYDARVLRKMKVSMGAPDLPVAAKIELAAGRLANFDPSRAHEVLTEARDVFLVQALFLENVNLRDIDDSYEVALPPGCERRQAAVQNEQVFDSDPYYVVDKRWWDKLDNDGKAALAMHEAIFRLAEKWTSSQVRAFNGFLFSDYFEKHSLRDFNLKLYGSGLEIPVQVFRSGDSWYYQVSFRDDLRDHFRAHMVMTPQDAGNQSYLPHETRYEAECKIVGDGVPLAREDMPVFSRDYSMTFMMIKEDMSANVLMRENGAYSTAVVRNADFYQDPSIKFGDLWCKSASRPY